MFKTALRFLCLLVSGFYLSTSASNPVSDDAEITFSSDVIQSGRVLDARNGNEIPVTFEVVDELAVVEGDIVLGNAASLSGAPPEGLDTQQYALAMAVTQIGSLWPLGIVPYQIHADLTSTSVPGKVAAAIADIESKTSINFVERTPSNASSYPDYLEIVNSTGCASYIGRTGGRQSVWLSPLCSTGNAIHEFGHALGLYHEQSRQDRDSFVTIHWENIASGKSFNFTQQFVNATDVGSYDYNSIMHYGRYYFSSNGSPTISPINPASASIGQRFSLSTGDAAALNDLYATDLSLTLQATPALVNPAAQITLSAHVTNLNPAAARTITLTVPVPTGSNYQGASGDWVCALGGSNIVCSRETLAGGANSSISIYMTAPSFGYPLTLSGQVSSVEKDLNTANNSDTVNVIVNSQNFAPTITGNQVFSVDPKAQNGATVGRVQATDDNNDPLNNFQIVSGTLMNALAINPLTGDLWVSDSSLLDMETTPQFTLDITTSDGQLTSNTGQVTINLRESTASNSASAGGGGSLSIVFLILALSAGLIRMALFSGTLSPVLTQRSARDRQQYPIVTRTVF